jgi:hypothetical protein
LNIARDRLADFRLCLGQVARVAGTSNASAAAWTESPNGRRNSSANTSPGWVVTRSGVPTLSVVIDDFSLVQLKQIRYGSLIRITVTRPPLPFRAGIIRNPPSSVTQTELVNLARPWRNLGGILSLPSRIYSLPSRNQFPAASLLRWTSFPCQFGIHCLFARRRTRFLSRLPPRTASGCVAASADRLCCRSLKIR